MPVYSFLKLSFSKEDAVGDGVVRDVYSIFYEEMYLKMDGNLCKVPSNNFDEEELHTIGKIITHGFILHNVFPVQLCKASLVNYLCGELTDNLLSSSFLEYLPPKEEDLIANFSESTDTQAIVDIFSEYGIHELPTVKNLPVLTKRTAKAALIKNPCFNMQNLVAGMGNFWKVVTTEMLESLYLSTIPCASKVIESLEANELSTQDQRVTTWLHRYLRSCANEELTRYIRFVTGSASFTTWQCNSCPVC